MQHSARTTWQHVSLLELAAVAQGGATGEDVGGEVVVRQRHARARCEPQPIRSTQGALLQHVEPHTLAHLAYLNAAARAVLGSRAAEAHCWHGKSLECIRLADANLDGAHLRAALGTGWRQQDVAGERARKTLKQSPLAVRGDKRELL